MLSSAIRIAGATTLIFMRLLTAAHASQLMDQAEAAYAKREDVPEAKIAMVAYERAALADPREAAEGFWKASRAAWWLGEHGDSREERLRDYQNGIDLARKALAANSNSAEGHLWLGGNLGSFGDVKGVMKSLSLIKPIRHEMQEVIRLNDRVDNGAAYQILGVVDYKVPGLVGGSKSRAKVELLKALSIGPNDPFNNYYLAEYYKTIGDAAKKNAQLEVLRTLQVSPESLPDLKMLQARADQQLK